MIVLIDSAKRSKMHDERTKGEPALLGQRAVSELQRYDSRLFSVDLVMCVRTHKDDLVPRQPVHQYPLVLWGI